MSLSIFYNMINSIYIEYKYYSENYVNKKAA